MSKEAWDVGLTDVERAEARVEAAKQWQASDAIDAGRHRVIAPILLAVTIICFVSCFMLPGFFVWFLLLGALFLVGSFFSFMIGFMS